MSTRRRYCNKLLYICQRFKFEIYILFFPLSVNRQLINLFFCTFLYIYTFKSQLRRKSVNMMPSNCTIRSHVFFTEGQHISCYIQLWISLITKNGVFWDVKPCGSCQNRHFGGTSVLTRATRHNIPEDTILHSHRRENLKFYSLITLKNNWFLPLNSFMSWSQNILKQ
jgi:hypothetical protein